jgi:hypothetical protein
LDGRGNVYASCTDAISVKICGDCGGGGEWWWGADDDQITLEAKKFTYTAPETKEIMVTTTYTMYRCE